MRDGCPAEVSCCFACVCVRAFVLYSVAVVRENVRLQGRKSSAVWNEFRLSDSLKRLHRQLRQKKCSLEKLLRSKTRCRYRSSSEPFAE